MANHRQSVLFDPRAEADIDEIAQWYAQERAELALDFLAVLDAAVAIVAQFPEASPEIAPKVRRILTRRFPFCVYYSTGDDRIVVFAVLHVRRRPETWRKRLEA
jgi:toxin ParE1/3/4